MAGYTASSGKTKLPARFANDDVVVYDLPSQSLYGRGSQRFYCGQGLIIGAPIFYFCVVIFLSLSLSYGCVKDLSARPESQEMAVSAGTRLVLQTTL